MRLFDGILAGLGALGLLALAGWSYLQFPSLAKGYEARLQSGVEAALAESGHDWVQVEMHGQTAYLSGQSGSEDARAQAVEVALSAMGAGGMAFGGVSQVEASFEEVDLVSPFIWRATRTAVGDLVLTGHVPSEAAKLSLETTANALSAGEVQDRTEIAAGAPEGNWLAVADMALASVAELDSGSARFEDASLYISGIAMDNERRARLSAEIAGLGEPFSGYPDIRGPSLWSARHVDGVLVLEGEVASEAERSDVYGIAAAHFEGEVVDEMRVAGEVRPGWIEGARLGLPHFARFQSGWFGFDPDGDGFTIAGKASGSVLAYLREDMANLGGSYAVTIDGAEVAVDVSELADLALTGDVRADCEAQFAAVLAANTVVFASGNAEISRESGTTLDKLMAVAGQCDEGLVLEIGGHTDSIGEPVFNVYLSEIRAQAVSDYMVEHGFATERLRVIGYGPDNPVADNATPEGRAANRRIEFKVLEQDE
ncbi:MAG: OmpA family protein [Hyphomonadaceae bacterium]|nr:OmpA family protein [Hyphomonadaceae bacterium]